MPAGLQIRWVLPAGQQKKSVLPAGQDVAASCDITASEATLPSCFLHELYTGFALRQFENPFRQKGPICPGGSFYAASLSTTCNNQSQRVLVV